MAPTKKSKKAAAPKLPRRIFANASPRSRGGVSLFEAGPQVTARTVEQFFSSSDLLVQAARRLEEAGFEVLQITPSSINIAGSRTTYEKAFDTDIYAEERPVIKPLQNEAEATFIDSDNSDLSGLIRTAGTAFADVLEGVAIEEPRYFMGPSAFAPKLNYWHLNVPAGVSLACNADKAHRSGVTGRGVRVAMVDSGWYAHPFFTERGYRVEPVTLGPGATLPNKDESGHGTGESANIFAVAPDAELLPVKMSFVNSKGAFDAALAMNPDIITCSWGSSKQFGPLSAADRALAASVATAVAAGVTVIFSAGNGHWGFPGQHPDVISAGGVFLDADGTLQASNYASGFISNIYPERRVPDVSGLVGMQPQAIYIALPVEPGDDIDKGLAGGEHPTGDETEAGDGWAVFSGTSAAAPQLAGGAALVKQAHPEVSPEELREVLVKSAKDVTAGSAHPNTGGNEATKGADSATGSGLVDAYKATLMAKLRRAGPVRLPPAAPPFQQPPSQEAPPVAQSRYQESRNPGLSHEDVAALEALLLGTD